MGKRMYVAIMIVFVIMAGTAIYLNLSDDTEQVYQGTLVSEGQCL